MHHDLLTPNELTDEELIQFVQDGNEPAFAELMSRYSPRIWQLIVANSRQRRDAEEILMDTWMAVWQNIRGLRRVSSFGGWLRRIAHTACNRYYTSAYHSQGETPHSYAELAEHIDRDADARFREAKLRADAREAVHHLPQRVRPVAVLFYLELWSIKEIAAELGLAIGTIKTKLRETRALLRKEFGVEPKGERTMSLKQQESKRSRTKINIIGVGGAGGNAVKRMIEAGLTGTEFYAVDTDREALATCHGATQVQIGTNTTQGLGAGARPEVGRRAAEEDKETLQTLVADAAMVFVTAGMGGGTGTGVAPLIASLAREQGTLTVGIVTRPFDSEGRERGEHAAYGLQTLRENVDSLIVVPNQRLIDTMEPALPREQVLRLSDETLCLGVDSILEIITDSGEINVDFTDVQTILRNKGTALMGIGQANGDNRAKIAAENAISSPLLEGENMEGADGMIVHLSAPPDFMMSELDAAMKVIQNVAPEAQIIFGLTYKDNPEPEATVVITVIATGVETQKGPAVAPPPRERGAAIEGGASEFVHLHNHSEYSLLV